MAEQIYSLIGEAMRKVGAIGKDSTATNGNGKQMYKFRGIDAVYNALNPVMADLGLFIVPEVLEQTREERKTVSGSTLIYSILKVKFSMYAPDGSHVDGVVTGEGMDSGDKASNKAMSVALKYFCFELLMIPTEEMVDPDAEVHDVAPKNAPAGVVSARQIMNVINGQEPAAKRTETAQKPAAGATVGKVPTVPPTAPKKPENVLEYLANERAELMKARGISQAENNALWKKQIEVLTAAGMIENKALSAFTMEEARNLINYMYTVFDPHGTELKEVEG